MTQTMRSWLGYVLSPKRRRARRAARQFEDPDTQRAAERVFLFLENVVHVRSDRVNPDAELSSLLAIDPHDLPFWRRIEEWLAHGSSRRLHTLENLRTGTVRHLINHLVICPVCRRRN